MSAKSKMESTAKDKSKKHASRAFTVDVPKSGTGKRGSEAGEQKSGGGMGNYGAGRYDEALGIKDPYGAMDGKGLHAGRPENKAQKGAGG